MMSITVMRALEPSDWNAAKAGERTKAQITPNAAPNIVRNMAEITVISSNYVAFNERMAIPIFKKTLFRCLLYQNRNIQRTIALRERRMVPMSSRLRSVPNASREHHCREAAS
jgi:hypothetical protein